MERQLKFDKRVMQCVSAAMVCSEGTHPDPMQQPGPAPGSDRGFAAALNQAAEPEEAAVADHSGAAGHSGDVDWVAAGFSVPAAAVGQACCPYCYSGAALPVCYPVTPHSDWECWVLGQDEGQQVAAASASAAKHYCQTCRLPRHESQTLPYGPGAGVLTKTSRAEAVGGDSARAEPPKRGSL